MKRTQTVLMAFLLVAGIARAQSTPMAIEIIGKHSLVEFDRVVVINKKETKVVVDEIPFKLKVPDDGGFLYIWTVPDGIKANRLAMGTLLEITSAPNGEVTFGLQSAIIENGKGKAVTYDVTLVIGAVVPPKPPPVPPNPPTPKPPVPAAGLRVLVVAESTAGSGVLLLTAKQINELYGEKMNDYARAKLAKGPDGTPEIRRVDKDSDVSKMNPVWREFFGVWQKEANGVVPWIIISNGTTGFSGPLPDGGVLELIKRYEP